MKRITRNAAKCLKCGDVVESTSRHELVWCSCRAMAVDGGHEYLRRLGAREDFEDMSEFEGSDSDEEET